MFDIVKAFCLTWLVVACIWSALATCPACNGLKLSLEELELQTDIEGVYENPWLDANYVKGRR